MIIEDVAEPLFVSGRRTPSSLEFLSVNPKNSCANHRAGAGVSTACLDVTNGP